MLKLSLAYVSFLNERYRYKEVFEYTSGKSTKNGILSAEVQVK